MIDDTYIIRGLSDILNKENIRPDIDVSDIERQMISKGVISRPSSTPVDRFDSEINDVVRKLGISLDVDEKKQEYDDVDSRFSAPSENTRENTREDNHDHYHINFDDDNYDQAEVEPSSDVVFERKTHEELRRNHIRNVIDDDGAQAFSLETEREEDDKCAMLAEIEFIMDSLKDVGVDVSRIPPVNDNNDASSIEKVLKVLRHKMDHSRYCTFADEFILAGAHGLEYLFDGKNTWFMRWKPNLSGWHVHVNRKLRRMRTDTGKIVSQVMNDYDIGPVMRVLLELVPSMLLFSSNKSKQNNLNNQLLDKDMIESRDALNSV